ncbi:MAG: aminotransferase class V-fold PLP-dependent enzyme [Microscillaceae bacterium]|nr:aminotransferase class V-fold PLP-dependent enzyme [Microscillaceae bacterium]
MSKKIFYTPGPSGLYPGLEKHLQKALEEHIPSISHRSNHFRGIYQDTFETLKSLFNIPQGFAVLFTGSATEIWERIIMSCVEEHSFHLVNGSFSQKFHETAQQLRKNAHKIEVPMGEGFELNTLEVFYKSELIALTHNETSTGVSMPTEDIHRLKEMNPNKLLAVDMVSSAPYPQLDFNKIDMAFFSVQKGFGLPAGLGVWIVHERCLAKSEKLSNAGFITGTYHRLSTLWNFFEKFQTPETPNVLGIYLLQKVAADMLKKGIKQIRKETDEKAKMLYEFLEQEEGFDIFVKNPAHRSSTVIIANTGFQSSKLIQKLSEKGFEIGSGYGENKDRQIRIANFPGTSQAEMEKLLDAMKKLRGSI